MKKFDSMKQVSAACERNKDPILAILRRVFSQSRHVLEIGSGTGQHAAHFAAGLPRLIWQTSDLPQYHESINAYIDESAATNLKTPVILDTGRPDAAQVIRNLNEKPENQNGERITSPIDAIFTANTIQIMAEEDIVGMFALIGEILPDAGHFCLYSPLQYAGRHTSEGNAEFDANLRARDPRMGVRDFVWLDSLARDVRLVLRNDHAMPAGNRLLEYDRRR